jgi:hypothetical protein
LALRHIIPKHHSRVSDFRLRDLQCSERIALCITKNLENLTAFGPRTIIAASFLLQIAGGVCPPSIAALSRK